MLNLMLSENVALTVLLIRLGGAKSINKILRNNNEWPIFHISNNQNVTCTNKAHKNFKLV